MDLYQELTASLVGLSSRLLQENTFQLSNQETAVLQVSCSSVSVFASTTMIVLVSRGLTLNNTPFRRIILGLSIADTLQSLALLTGPWLSTPWVFQPDLWSAGNEASCHANGFILILGATAVPMYTSFLCLYYLCKLKYKMSDADFTFKFEKWIHYFIIAFNLVAAVLALQLKAINPIPTGNFCHFAVVPRGCAFIAGMDCDPLIQVRVRRFQWVLSFLLPACCLLATGVTAGMLYRHSYVVTKVIRKQLRKSMNDKKLRRRKSLEPGTSAKVDLNEAQGNPQVGESLTALVPNEPQRGLENLSRLYTREMTIQTTLYIGSFCLTYIPVFVIYVMILIFDTNPSFLLNNIGLCTYCLGGVWTILVYTRPKVASFRRSHPDCSRLRGLFLVIKNGGEVPKTYDTSFGCFSLLCRAPRPTEEAESTNADGSSPSSQRKIGQSLSKSSNPIGLNRGGPSGFKDPIGSSLLFASLDGMNGRSDSFGTDHDLYTPPMDWTYERGDDVNGSLDIIEEANEEDEESDVEAKSGAINSTLSESLADMSEFR